MATKSPDYDRALGNLEGSVGVLTKLTFAVISFLIAIVAGGVFLLVQIYDVKSTVADIKRDLGSAVERIGKIEAALSEVKTGQGSVASSLARIESSIASARPPTSQPILVPQLLMSVNDAGTIRSALKFDPDTAYKGVGKIGDVLTDAKLSDFPKDLIEQFPQLKTLRYVFDAKNQILIATALDQRVIALIV
jgi:hypothetical protein